MVVVQPRPKLAALAALAILVAPFSAFAQDATAPEEQPPPGETPPAPTEPTPTEPAPTEPTSPAVEPAPTAPTAPAEPAPSAPAVEEEEERSSSEPRVIVHVNQREEEEEEEEEEEPPPRSPFDPHELPEDKLYHFGVFARGIFIPQYGQNFFVTGGNDALRPAGGAFFNYRQDNFNFIVEVWGGNFFNQAAYHGLNETDFETEWIESELSILFVTFAMMYSIPFTSWLALEIGGAIGGGGVFGGLWRTEAYPDPTARSGWTPCARPGDPADTDGRYCDAAASDNPAAEGSYDRRDGVPQPYNFSGGVPPLWFWIELPRVALRFKPLRQLQIRAEAGFAIIGVQFGASVAIGF